MKKEEVEEILDRVKTYIEDVLTTGPWASGEALEKENMYKFAYFHASMAVAQDIRSILGGKEIQSVQEYMNEEKTSSSQKVQDANGMTYT